MLTCFRHADVHRLADVRRRADVHAPFGFDMCSDVHRRADVHIDVLMYMNHLVVNAFSDVRRRAGQRPHLLHISARND